MKGRAADEIVVDVRAGGEVRITIDRPRKHNALKRSTLAALAAAVTQHAEVDGTRFIVVRGAGESYFAAGGDLVDLADVRSASDTEAMTDEATAALDAVRHARVPVVAYVNGDALGGGAELAVACDLRVIAARARIGYVHGRLAITPAWGGGTDLVRLVGAPRAMRMMVEGAMIGATQALDWGLVDAVVESESEVDAFIAPLRAAAPHVLRAIKAQVAAAKRAADYTAQRAVERRALVESWTHADHWAAVERFLKRN